MKHPRRLRDRRRRPPVLSNAAAALTLLLIIPLSSSVGCSNGGGGGRAAPPVPEIEGAWSGTWLSHEEPGRFGNIELELLFGGNQVDGFGTLTGTPCSGSEGSLSGNQLGQELFLLLTPRSPNIAIHLTGTVSEHGRSARGTYVIIHSFGTGGCGDSGVWTASR